MMRTLKHHGARTALVAGAIALAAGLGAAVLTAGVAPASPDRSGARLTADLADAELAAAELAAADLTAGGLDGSDAAADLAADAGTSTGGSPRSQRRAAGGAATLDGIKARSAQEIARRQASLSARLTLVTSGSPSLTSADRTALTTMIKNDQAGLSALAAKIAADTDLATAKADHQQIFTGYRVYALLMPQVRLVRANDALIGVALPKLTDAQTRLRSALARTGKTDEAAAQMADLQAQIDAIRNSTTGLSAQVLALTPAQWNADHGVLEPSRKSLLSARTALQKARADIAAIRALIR